MQQASSDLAGVAFHCYSGSDSDQQEFTSQFPNKEVYFTECTGEYGSDWWSDIKVRGRSARLLVFLVVCHLPLRAHALLRRSSGTWTTCEQHPVARGIKR